jgi:hypothetical protein
MDFQTLKRCVRKYSFTHFLPTLQQGPYARTALHIVTLYRYLVIILRLRSPEQHACAEEEGQSKAITGCWLAPGDSADSHRVRKD